MEIQFLLQEKATQIWAVFNLKELHYLPRHCTLNVTPQGKRLLYFSLCVNASRDEVENRHKVDRIREMVIFELGKERE